jgi:CheY-like chemotaxis protein
MNLGEGMKGVVHMNRAEHMNRTERMTRIDLLVVDDSPADRASLKIAFAQSGYPVNVHFAASGALALDHLKSANKARPQVMLVDVKMPGLSGLDLLRMLKTDPALRQIPVFMFSGSDDKRDVSTAYSHHANAYIRKPADLDGLSDVAAVVGRLCTTVLSLPEQ